jgi:hypothetical protein
LDASGDWFAEYLDNGLLVAHEATGDPANFAGGFPAGRFALWAFWEAPCSAWIDYGFVDGCTDPGEVLALFASGVDSPWEPSEVAWDRN